MSVHPGPGIFMLNRPEISEAHHIFGPVGGTPPARSTNSSALSMEWNPEIEAKAIASSVVSTCSVEAVSPIRDLVVGLALNEAEIHLEFLPGNVNS